MIVANLSKILILKVGSMKSKSPYFVLTTYANNSIHLNFKQRNCATLSLIFSDFPKLAIVYHSPLSLQFNVTDKLQTIIGIFTRLNPGTRKTPGEIYLLYNQIMRNLIP